MNKEEAIKKFSGYFKNKRITKQEGSFSSLVWGVAASSIESVYYKKYYPKMDFGPILCLYKNEEGIGFFNLDSYLWTSENRLKKYLNNEKSVIEFKIWSEYREKIKHIYIDNSPNKIASFDIKGLEGIIGRVVSLLQDMQIITLFCEALDENIVKKHFDGLKEEESLDIHDFFETASLSHFDSLASLIDSALLEHKENSAYLTQWILASYLSAPKIEKVNQEVKKMITEKGGINKIKQEKLLLNEEIKENKDKVNIYKKKLSPELERLFDFTQKTIELRDTRKKEILMGITLLSNAVREMFIKLNIPSEYILYSLHTDFKNKKYLESNYFDILKERKNGMLVYYGEEVEYFLVDYNLTKKDLFYLMDKDNNEFIRGNVAQKGLVKAIAKVILSQKDFNKLEDGDVLVTSMTRPEFFPLMKKASAIVTDEGGLTCHAAIISRELKKPCVIGTKNATRMIHDGDEIEVDAINGEVKIINNF